MLVVFTDTHFLENNMSTRNWFTSSLVLGVTSLGCAHQSAVVKESQPMAPVAARASAPAAVAAESSQSGQDLRALLRGAAIRFGFNEDVLTSDSETRLNALADALKANPTATIRISGNCDERGTEEYNLALGQRRADVAKQYLVRLGVEGPRVDTISYGFERPLDASHNEDAWALNRRDELSPQGN